MMLDRDIHPLNRLSAQSDSFTCLGSPLNHLLVAKFGPGCCLIIFAEILKLKLLKCLQHFLWNIRKLVEVIDIDLSELLSTCSQCILDHIELGLSVSVLADDESLQFIGTSAYPRAYCIESLIAYLVVSIVVLLVAS